VHREPKPERNGTNAATPKSEDEKQQAVKVAQETQGVQKVEDRLTVSAS
jgi:hypothetical protein